MNYEYNRSPWDADKAFDVFFDEYISVEIKTLNGTKRQSLPCCVFSDQIEMPIDPDMVASVVKSITITCRRRDWCFIKLLKVGDKVKRASNGMEYSITDVDDELTQEIIIKARRC